MAQTLDAAALIDTMAAFRDALQAHKETLNRLNVYPVPDGDTGTNMSLTLESVVDEIVKANGGVAPEMTGVCKAVSHGSLMGARGNSGVILSQILRGFSDELKERESAGAPELAAALVRASDAAYGAVMRPVEGTILTVAREAARGARDAAAGCAGLEPMLEATREAAAEALRRTPEMLPVLAAAGVVDAGGSGFLLMIDALLFTLCGRPVPEPPDTSDAAAVAAGPVDLAHHEDFTAETGGDLRYEVMYLLEAPDESVSAFKSLWAGIGDSIVVVGGEGLFNCHIHTDDIGAAIEAGIDVGRPRSIRITDLAEQVGRLEMMEEERWVREGAHEPDSDEAGYSGPPVTTGVVAVSNGDGIRRIFASLGVHRVVRGGQSMNPSTQDLLDAIEATPAGEVVVLPNNVNIIPVARQAAELSSKAVQVVPTRGIPQAFAALLRYDPDAPVSQNAAAMEAAVEHAVYGEVTRAVRDATSEIGPIIEGDWIGLSGRGIEVARGSLSDAACALLARLVGEESEVVTIIEGEGATNLDTRHVAVWLSDNRPDVEVEIHHGGQPLYPYLFGID